MLTLLLALSAALLVNGASGAPPTTVTLDVKNMTCELCPVTVRKALERVPGVSEAKVDYTQKIVLVKFDPAQVAPTALVKATTDAGFPSTVRQ